MPVIVTPVEDTSETFKVEAGNTLARYGQPVRLDVFDRAASLATYALEMRRRRATQPRQPLSDPIVATRSIVTDEAGFAQLTWTPDTRDAQFSGPKYRYYPRVVSVADTSRWAVGQEFKDIRVNDRTWSLLETLDKLLGPVQAVPVYSLRSRDSGSEARTEFTFPYRAWREDYPTVVWRASELREEPEPSANFQVDADTGRIVFYQPVPAYDDIFASFVFRLIAEDTLRGFLDQAIRALNFSLPETHYTLEDMPDAWEPYVIYGAAAYALQDVMTTALFREGKLIFEDAAQVGTLQSFYEKMGSLFEEARTKKKRWSLARPRVITGMDTIAPPRITPQSFQAYAFIRGRTA